MAAAAAVDDDESSSFFAFLACTSLLISLYVVIIGTESSGDLCDTHDENITSHSWLSWPSLAAFMYLKNRNISGFSEDGLRSSFSSLEPKIIIIIIVLCALFMHIINIIKSCFPLIVGSTSITISILCVDYRTAVHTREHSALVL